MKFLKDKEIDKLRKIYVECIHNNCPKVLRSDTKAFIDKFNYVIDSLLDIDGAIANTSIANKPLNEIITDIFKFTGIYYPKNPKILNSEKNVLLDNRPIYNLSRNIYSKIKNNKPLEPEDFEQYFINKNILILMDCFKLLNIDESTNAEYSEYIIENMLDNLSTKDCIRFHKLMKKGCFESKKRRKEECKNEYDKYIKYHKKYSYISNAFQIFFDSLYDCKNYIKESVKVIYSTKEKDMCSDYAEYINQLYNKLKCILRKDKTYLYGFSIDMNMPLLDKPIFINFVNLNSIAPTISAAFFLVIGDIFKRNVIFSSKNTDDIYITYEQAKQYFAFYLDEIRIDVKKLSKTPKSKKNKVIFNYEDTLADYEDFIKGGEMEFFHFIETMIAMLFLTSVVYDRAKNLQNLRVNAEKSDLSALGKCVSYPCNNMENCVQIDETFDEIIFSQALNKKVIFTYTARKALFSTQSKKDDKRKDEASKYIFKKYTDMFDKFTKDYLYSQSFFIKDYKIKANTDFKSKNGFIINEICTSPLKYHSERGINIIKGTTAKNLLSYYYEEKSLDFYEFCFLYTQIEYAIFKMYGKAEIYPKYANIMYVFSKIAMRVNKFATNQFYGSVFKESFFIYLIHVLKFVENANNFLTDYNGWVCYKNYRKWRHLFFPQLFLKQILVHCKIITCNVPITASYF